MGLFDAFKTGSKEAEQEVLEKFWTLTERFSQTLRMSSVLLEGNLSRAGFDAKQKATFNAAILLGLLEGIEKIVNDKHITQKIRSRRATSNVEGAIRFRSRYSK